MDNPYAMKNDIATQIATSIRAIYKECTQKYPQCSVHDVVEATGIGIYTALTSGVTMGISCAVVMELCKVIVTTHDLDHEKKEEISKKAKFN